MAAQIMTLVFLVIYTIMDIRYRKIYRPLGYGMIAGALVLHLILRDMSIPAMLTGLLPGLGIAAMSKLSKEAVGAGDALAVCVCGAMLGFDRSFRILLISLILAACFAAIILIRKGRDAKDEEFPFVPFLLAGQICQMLL